MHDRVKFCFSAFVYYSGIVKLIRWCTQHFGRHLIILYYHRAVGQNLRKQWLYLRRHYHILPLETALQELNNSLGEKSDKRDRRTLLAITFDDGYYDNYTHAFPLARELEIPITIFAIPGYTGCANAFWWADRLIRLAQVDQVSFEEHIYHLDQQEERKALAQIIDDRMSTAASANDRKELIISICKVLAVPFSAMPREEPVPLLTWTQVREMEESGWISFGVHTTHHSDLERLTNPVEVQREVGECRTMLEQQLGHPVNIFAYPYGHIGDHGLYAVKQAGYKWAFTTLPGLNSVQRNPHLLFRRKADADNCMFVVAAETVGVLSLLTHLKRYTRLLMLPLRRISIMLRQSNELSTEKG